MNTYLKSKFKAVMTSLLGILFAVTLILTGNDFALAASCHGGGGGESVCVLTLEQNIQLGITTSLRDIKGEFDPYGHYTPNPIGNTTTTWTTVIGSAIRLNEDWQLGVSLPVMQTKQVINNEPISHTGIGDPSVEGRYTLWEDLAFLVYKPELSFYVGARLPLGKSIYESTHVSGADITGSGFVTAHVGATAAKLYRPVRIAVDGALFYPFAKEVQKIRNTPISTPYQLKSGNRFQLSESVTYLPTTQWSGTLGFRQLWSLESSIDGSSVSGSAGRSFWGMIALGYFQDDWSYGLSYETSFPFERYFANQSRSDAFTLNAAFNGL